MRHRYEEVRRGSDEGLTIVGNEDAGARIDASAPEQAPQTVRGLRVSELLEESSELIGVVYLGRANGHSGHLG